MKRFMKIFAVTGLALAVAAVTAPKAQAGAWGIAAGVVGGLAVGTTIGLAAAHTSAPAYYAYPGPAYAYTSYAAPTYVAAVPAQQVVCAAPVVYPAAYPYCYRGYYGPRYYGPAVRVGLGWGGPRYHYHRR